MRCSSLLLASILAAPLAHADTESAEDMLRSTLQQKFPNVQRWEIRRFDDRESVGAVPSVVRVGARSAVRVGHRLQWFAVAGFQDVVSAARNLGVGTALSATEGRVKERDVIAANCDPLTDPSALTGMRARRPLRANEVICTQSIEPRPTVSRGDTVTVRYVGARVVLLTKAVAKADGNVGDLLVVSHAKSKDSFAATVSGVGEVTIHE